MIPQLIRDKANSRTPLVRRLDGPVCAGDVRRVESGGEQRLVLVLKVQQDRNNAQITLIHPYDEYATSADVVVDSSISGELYPIVVQAGMRGVVWLNDLEPIITSVPSEVVAICLSPAKLVPTGAGLSSGPPLTGPLDARWDFKNSECESLSRLCADCTSSALEEEVSQ